MASDSKEFEFDLKWTANSMYAASIDTVSQVTGLDVVRLGNL